jgi:hypothetical protein
MKNQWIIVVLAAVALIGVGYVLLQNAPGTPAAVNTATTTPVASGTPAAVFHQPTLKVGDTKVTTIPASGLFDTSSFTSTSTYPTVTGTANVPLVGIVVSDAEGTGIVGSANVVVEGGHWSYTASVALMPGSYHVTLYVGKNATVAKLTVK